MKHWHLPHDPLPFLLETKEAAILFSVKRDLLGLGRASAKQIWTGVEARRILRNQLPDGRWRYPGGYARVRSKEDYDQIETYRQLGVLVEKFRLTRDHPAIERAASFMFSHQTDEGDFRGIYGNQYSPNYSAAIMELLIKAGYADDDRIGRGFSWLLSMRQDDGGWAIPLRTVAKPDSTRLNDLMRSETLAPDRRMPSSHLATGMVLRAFAADGRRRASPETRRAGVLLVNRFLRADRYVDRKSPDFWWRVSFPFWFTDIVSALDSLSQLGFSAEEQGISGALSELSERQLDDGSFRLKLLRTGQTELNRWVCFAVCRVFKRLYA